MPRLTPEQKNSIKEKAGQPGATLRGLAKEYRVSDTTIRRVVGVRQLEKIKDRVRTADEFTAPERRPVRRDRPTLSWALETIRLARDAQLSGDFARPVALAKMMRTDDALFTAYHNRIAPQAALGTELKAAAGARGAAVARKAAVSCIVPRTVLQSIVGTLADHGIAIGYVKQETSEDGSRTDFELTEWPLEHVRYNTSTEQLEARTRDNGYEPIIHGNGRWIVFKKFAVEPWTKEACVLPGAMVWAAHANGLASWSASADSHGRAQVVGELPEGVSLQDADGNLTPEANAYLTLLQDIVSGNIGAGIRPHGSTTEFVANNSTAWQVFKELIVDRKGAAARIYLGTDAILGSVGGAPGVDIAQLFGVATTKIQGDLTALEQGLFTGLFQPWAAVNEGDSRYAPRLVYLLPDVDQQKDVEDFDARLEKLLKRVADLKAQGMIVGPDLVALLCAKYKIDAKLVELDQTGSKKPAITLAPTDFASVTRVKEARASGGLDSTGDAKIDNMFLPQFKAYLESSGVAAGEATAPAQPGAAPVDPAAPAAPAPVTGTVPA